MNLCILYIVCIGVCHMYNETIFKILSCETEQSWDHVHALSKKEKQMLQIFPTVCVIIWVLLRLVFEVL